MKKKILIIGPFPFPVSGVSLANEVIAKGLREKDWEVMKINTEFAANISNSHGSISLGKIKFLKSYLSIYKILLTKIVYITIGQSFFGVMKYLPFIIVSKILNKKLVVHLHGNYLLDEYNRLKGIKKSLFHKVISWFDYGIVLSESLRKNFEPFLKTENIFELNNFFENSLVVPEKELINKKDYSTLKVVFLSNLIEEKGINILIEAIEINKKKGINIDLKVAGNLVTENDLSELFIKNEIDYKGGLYGEEKKNFLRDSNVFCLPTFYKMEGQPISILEAMALGNLILTTNHAGIADICKSENAVFCKKNDALDLANKLEELYFNPNIIAKKGIYNIEYSKKHFTEEQFIINANTLLEKCIY